MVTSIGGLLVGARRAVGDWDPGGVYDEVLREVSSRAAADGSVGKAEIGALVCWKRVTAQTEWARRLMLTPEVAVRAATAAAFERANNAAWAVPLAGQAARNELRILPGMGGTAALASAVLVALAPGRMAVWDRRVGDALSALGMYPRGGSEFYGSYLTVAVGLAETMDEAVDEAMDEVQDAGYRAFTPRDVDLALFWTGRNPRALQEARQAAGGR